MKTHKEEIRNLLSLHGFDFQGFITYRTSQQDKFSIFKNGYADVLLGENQFCVWFRIDTQLQKISDLTINRSGYPDAKFPSWHYDCINGISLSMFDGSNLLSLNPNFFNQIVF